MSATLDHRQSVDVYRQLSVQDAAFEPELARALARLRRHMVAMGEVDGQWPIADELISVRAKLAEADPDDHAVAYCQSLRDVASTLLRAGHPDQAIARLAESAKLLRRLAATELAWFPTDLAPILATELVVTGARLDEVGRPSLALDVTQDAVDLFRQLHRADPEEYEAALASALSNVAALRSDVSRL